MTKKHTVLFLLIFANLTLKAQFNIGLNTATGALNQITNPSDQYKMNWIFSSSDGTPTWQQIGQNWGLGKYSIKALNVQDERWTNPVDKTITKNGSSFSYKTKILDVLIERHPVGMDYLESYTFVNNTKKEVIVSNLDIYTPFNDNYPDAITCATNRCNAHIWPGMNSSYVNALRMNGQGPNLGLVFTKGAMKSYSIDNRGKDGGNGYASSNVRGTIVLNIAPFVLKAGAQYTVQWKLFWHKGWDDFFKIAKLAGFVKVESDRYVISKGEKLHIKIDAPTVAKVKQKSIDIVGNTLGEHTQKINYDNGKKYTTLKYYVISSPKKIIDKRIHFIVENQQMNNISDNRYGAYMVYDNQLRKIFDKPEGTVSNADRDEGAERLGMGVFIASWLQKHQDERVKKSLIRYADFVRHKLQTPDYKVYSNASKTSRHRGYNYPWVAHLYLESYKLTKENRYLMDFYMTLRKYFKEFGYQHYSIDFRVKDGIEALNQNGMKSEKDSLLNDFLKVGDYFAENGINYPKHEVNYEQSIVAPSVTLLCELYLMTKNEKYLSGAKQQLPSLEAFNGRQPDVHLNEIAIRHWDGYWFGKIPTWGDVMPHYWSTLTAVAFHKYYLCTGDKNYEVRAKKILNNNLLNFKENGMASCAYIYPAYVNNIPAKFYDQFANDQDWALVFYQEVYGK